MAPLQPYREIIAAVLHAYTLIPYAYGDLRTEAIVDHTQDHYMLVTIGWDSGMRVYAVLAHIQLRDAKVWIEHDNTEDGIATELSAAGIPKDQIVLGFRPPEIRPYTEYAVA
jgi:hypothetical protein